MGKRQNICNKETVTAIYHSTYVRDYIQQAKLQGYSVLLVIK